MPAAGTDIGTRSFANNKSGDNTFITTLAAEGSAHPGSPDPSRMSTPGGEAAAAAEGREPAVPLDGAMRAADGTPSAGGAGVAETTANVGGRAGLGRVPSSNAFGESGLFSAAVSGLAGGLGATGGGKRARDRRADRRKKKDPFEALEERLLDGFSLESITKLLQQQDQTLQKGVRRAVVIIARIYEPKFLFAVCRIWASPLSPVCFFFQCLGLVVSRASGAWKTRLCARNTAAGLHVYTPFPPGRQTMF